VSAPANPDPAAGAAESAAGSTPGPALRIGRYAVEQVIGTGAFATVYRARDERLGATVAVKLLADNHCLDPDIRARFIDEGRVLRRIDSPHVVRVYDVGETERLQPYLVLEHADRGTLAQRVEALRAGGWRPTIADTGAVAIELAAAVTAVHAAGLVHRDLSPGNLLLRSGVPPRPAGGADHAPAAALLRADERLLVADLGLSKDLARSSGLTVAGGTDGFRPPEQRAGPSRVDGRADVWALSAVLLWLVTGQPPPADGPVSATELDRALVPLPLPAALARPLVTSLHDDPDRRHPDAATWLAAVEAALAPSPARPPANAAGSAGPSRRRLLVSGAALAVGGVLAGVVGAHLADGSGDGSGPAVTARDRGRTAVTDRAGEAVITLVGRPEADAGDTVTFTAEVDGVDHWAWLMPDGAVYVDRPSVQMSTRSAGVATVTLVAVAPSGERLEARHELHLVEP
jgi:eukaryotic-like serine/threonine-protein kinase